MNYNIQMPLPFTDDGRDLDLTGPEDIADYTQNQVKIVISTFAGQYVFDTTAGVDWFTLLQKSVPRDIIREGIRTAILEQCEFVVRVEGLETSYDSVGRSMGVAYKIGLVDGSTIAGDELL